MKQNARRTIWQRITAFVLSILLIIITMPVSGLVVHAETTEHPGQVTVSVTDSNGTAVSGVNVSYTIASNDSESGFTPITNSAITDEYGVVEVLDSTNYVNGLVISATVSKEGYVTDSTTLANTDITSDTQNFTVELAEDSVIPDIEGVTIDVLDADFNESERELVYVSVSTEGALVEYSTDNVSWDAVVPKGENAGEYPVYVRISKSGYNTYQSGLLTAKINKINITGIDITANEKSYVENTEQELVVLDGAFENTDTVTWYVNQIDTTSRDIPTGMAVGSYNVTLVVNRGSNYNEFSKTVTAKINNAQLDLTGLEVTGLDSVYDGTRKELVSVNNPGNYTLMYQLDDGDKAVDNAAWVTEIPSEENAGSYIVWVKATKPNYEDAEVTVTPAAHAVAPYNVCIRKAEQIFSFDDANYNTNISINESESTSDVTVYDYGPSEAEVTAEDFASGKTFNFATTDRENKAGGTISYSVELDTEDIGIASIDQNGLLTVNGVGKVIIKATLSGDNNYKACVIRHTLYVSGKVTSSGAWVSFPNATVEYTMGNVDGIQSNVAVRKNSKDRGAITYSIENSDSIGLSINNTDNPGKILINDYGKLIRSIESSDGMLNVTVTADKAEYTRGLTFWSTSKYPADSVTYVLKITMADIPSNPYKVFAESDLDNELVSANGSNGWYNSTLVVKPVEGYKIIRADELIENDNPIFKTSVKLGEITDDNALDQGENTERVVYLRNTTTGEITKRIVTGVEKLDNLKPYNLDIIFPEKEEIEGVKYYGEEITVTFVAYDSTSGVEQFDWVYTRESGTSESALESADGKVPAYRDSSDPSHVKYVGTLTLPKNQAEQLRGNLQISATDKAGNTSEHYTDTGVFVVDTILPVDTSAEMRYRLKNGEGTTQTVGLKQYFSNDVEFTFDIEEANFYASDVNVMVSKNGNEAEKQALRWINTNNADEYEANLTLSEEGDYIVSVTYTDRSGKEMVPYTSETIVIDKTSPVIEFEYKDHTDSTTPQSATVKITEHNFRASDIELETIAKNIAGDVVTGNNLQQYLRTCEWTSVGDVHTATISGQFVDAIYELTLNYTDLALREAAEVKTNAFTVDRTAPKTEDMSVTYSTPILETILSSIFGFYNPNVTVTFTGYDSISKIEYFTWSYLKEAGASDINVPGYTDIALSAIQDSTDKTKYTATVTLPADVAEQLRGSISFTATDASNNTSNKLTDANHVIVVDTIAPTMNVEYSAADNSFDGKDYYNKSLTATFIVNEANFFEEDVTVKLKKNDGSAEVITPSWVDSSADVHVGTYTIEASTNHVNDGDYVFTVEYKDCSNNEMAVYTSEVKVIDTTKPVIKVEYANTNPVNTLTDSEGYQRKYFNSANTATITITEHNFNVTEAKYTIVAKDVAGNQLNASSYYTISSWKTTGDNHVMTITYPGDANYTFDFEYTDLAKLKADDYNTEYFTVDTSGPTDFKVTYSTSILDTILSTITFGFYNAKSTVVISAKDSTSGINSMKYSYINADGVSNVNAQLVDVVIDASQITRSDGDTVGTASFEIPNSVLAANNQFNGTVSFTASDRANNESDYFRDTKRIVVDNIAPTANVEYNIPVQQVNGIAYYDADVNATVTINEANFYEEDVHITVTKDGVATPVTANWSSGNVDVHTGTFTLSGDGDYFVTINYADKSGNAIQEYTSGQMTIDTVIEEASMTVNGQEADGKAFKGEVVPAVSFEDKNFESCEIKLYRTSFADKNVDVTEKFISGYITTNETGGSGSFDTFKKTAENDGIYTMTAEMKDKAGHTIKKSITFTVNRFGSVYEYNDYLISLIKDGGAFVQSVDEDLEITEYNADRLLSGSLSIEISRDGRPLDNSQFTVSPEMNENVEIGSSGWYQYSYKIGKENFSSDGVYKISISSKDATGNSPENSNYEDKGILFRVDSTAPEITSISGLENSVINATEQTVKYTVFDTIGLASVSVFVDDKQIDVITDFAEDINNYSGAFVIKENNSAQTVRFVVTDLAGNITDTDADDFTSSYVFSDSVTVSTNFLVRWFANKPLFYGTIGGGTAAVGSSVGVAVFFRRRKLLRLMK